MYFGDYTAFYNSLPFPWWLLVVVLIWTLPWKGAALWKSARHHQLIWFIILLLVNSLGILEIFYIKFGQRKDEEEERSSQNVENKSST